MIRNCQEIKSKIENEIIEKEAMLASWKNVKFLTKKDGKPYKYMAKNINGAIYLYDGQYTHLEGEYSLKIVYHTKVGGYGTDTIFCYESVKYITSGKEKEKPQNIITYGGCYYDTYVYDIDDIKEAVKNRIAKLEDNIASLKMQVEIVEKCYDNFNDDFHNVLNNLAKNCNCEINIINRNTLFTEIVNNIVKKFI